MLVESSTHPGRGGAADPDPGNLDTTRTAAAAARTHARNATTNTKHDFPVGVAGALSPPTSDTIPARAPQTEGKLLYFGGPRLLAAWLGKSRQLGGDGKKS